MPATTHAAYLAECNHETYFDTALNTICYNIDLYTPISDLDISIRIRGAPSRTSIYLSYDDCQYFFDRHGRVISDRRLMSFIRSLIRGEYVAPLDFDRDVDISIAKYSIIVPLSEASLASALYHARNNMHAGVEILLSDRFTPRRALNARHSINNLLAPADAFTVDPTTVSTEPTVASALPSIVSAPAPVFPSVAWIPFTLEATPDWIPGPSMPATISIVNPLLPSFIKPTLSTLSDDDPITTLHGGDSHLPVALLLTSLGTPPSHFLLPPAAIALQPLLLMYSHTYNLIRLLYNILLCPLF
ncbi:hypothetical protein SEMRO_2385_G325710.1 [Seminavis robusta]|uniref:Uncharacterized protein n=1 Tax=Seminavis robusta TaxID=568900 RepID=A0A9N8EXH6_9STRA|nr:hypothetical protein SEMRO_2385_G325710.1 [Seminavis robusta]|eukprot:Sro2385_g325710.1 n/a (302) ;mRNA; r:9605-10510